MISRAKPSDQIDRSKMITRKLPLQLFANRRYSNEHKFWKAPWNSFPDRLSRRERALLDAKAPSRKYDEGHATALERALSLYSASKPSCCCFAERPQSGRGK